MRSENEIREQVETRLRRWALLVLNGILWISAAKLIHGVSQVGGFGMFTGLVALIMVVWAALLGLHALRVFYVELREWLVKRAIRRERRLYQEADFYEKRKRDPTDTARLSLQAEDGELTEFPFNPKGDFSGLTFNPQPEAKAKHEG